MQVPHFCKGWTNIKNKSRPNWRNYKLKLNEEQETAIREKRDYTVNQQKLADNIQ